MSSITHRQHDVCPNVLTTVDRASNDRVNNALFITHRQHDVCPNELTTVHRASDYRHLVVHTSFARRTNPSVNWIIMATVRKEGYPQERDANLIVSK